MPAPHIFAAGQEPRGLSQAEAQQVVTAGNLYTVFKIPSPSSLVLFPQSL